MFYSKLYTSENPTVSHSLHDFLDGIEIPVVGNSAKKDLNSPIPLCELSEAIDGMKGGKSPRPNGIPINMYNTLKRMLLNCFGIGSYFLKWIKVFYHDSRALVLTNYMVSP